MPFAFPVFRMERLDSVSPTLSESWFSDVFRFAIITSKFTIIGIKLYSSGKLKFERLTVKILC